MSSHAFAALDMACVYAELDGEDDDRPLRTGLTIKIPKPTENPFHFKKRKGVAYGAVRAHSLPALVCALSIRCHSALLLLLLVSSLLFMVALAPWFSSPRVRP